MLINKVFLGGTCNGSTWRERIKPLLTIPYFDPVVPVWDSEAQAEEWLQKEESRFRLYCITPKMTGVFSIAEVVDDSNRFPNKTILVVLREDDGEEFSEPQIKSLKAVENMILRNGATVASSLKAAAKFMNEEA